MQPISQLRSGLTLLTIALMLAFATAARADQAEAAPGDRQAAISAIGDPATADLGSPTTNSNRLTGAVPGTPAGIAGHPVSTDTTAAGTGLGSQHCHLKPAIPRAISVPPETPVAPATRIPSATQTPRRTPARASRRPKSRGAANCTGSGWPERATPHPTSGRQPIHHNSNPDPTQQAAQTTGAAPTRAAPARARAALRRMRPPPSHRRRSSRTPPRPSSRPPPPS